MGFNFLSLPREIRDLIYAYVVQDVRYRHSFVTDAHPNGLHPRYGNVIRVIFEDTPSVNLLLSQSQLYHEYKQATQTFQCSARIRVDTLSKLPCAAVLVRADDLQ